MTGVIGTAEYIKREAALDIVNGWREQLIPTYGKNDEYVKCLETVAEHLETLPAADVVERKPMAEDVEEFVARLRDFAVELRKAEDALLVRHAADAIEELSCKYQKALDDLVKRAEPPKEEI